MRQTPALHSGTLLRGRPNDLSPRTDNSNTQFAILGVLAAERYDVPMERAMALIDWRFRHSQSAPGRWQYQRNFWTTPAMTGAALLGLALKHGLVESNARRRGRSVVLRDPLINRAVGVWSGDLDGYLGAFLAKREPLQKLDIYVLWTVERVAALYGLRRLGKLDWYVTGVRLLLPLQLPDGSWSPAAMRAQNEPAVSTSFALLFLERSNLARDLTRRLSKLAAPRER